MLTIYFKIIFNYNLLNLIMILIMKLNSLKNILGSKKPKAAKTRVLTAEGWKRRFSQRPLKAKKTAKR